MIRLEHTMGHNKYYELHLVRDNGRITVKGLYGAIGQAPKEHTVYDGDDEREALAEMEKKRLEKEKKGYILVGGNGEPTTTPPVQKKRTTPL